MRINEAFTSGLTQNVNNVRIDVVPNQCTAGAQPVGPGWCPTGLIRVYGQDAPNRAEPHRTVR